MGCSGAALRRHQSEPAMENQSDRTSECLAAGGALPALERRKAEDELAEAVYRDVPGPERELLALVHTMLSRGLLAEGELAARMRAVRSRLEEA